MPSTAAKQQRLTAQPVIPATASIPVALDKIPQNLPPRERAILVVNYDRAASSSHTAWFRDCEDVRRVLGIRG